MSEPEPSHRYTAAEADEVFEQPIGPVRERLAEQAAEQRPDVERAIRALGHEPAER